MIFKITRNYDKWGNIGTPYADIVEKKEFKAQITRYVGGSMTEVEYHEALNMVEVCKIVVPNMFENYTEYAKFLITAESTLKLEPMEVIR